MSRTLHHLSFNKQKQTIPLSHLRHNHKTINMNQLHRWCISIVLSFSLLSLHVIPASTSTDYIRTSCSVTLYPDVCYNSLSHYANSINNDPARLAQAAISVTLTEARRTAAYMSKLSRQADPRAAAALHDCFSNFGDAVDEIQGSLKQMRQLVAAAGGASEESFRFQMSNVQTWMSAALTDEETCTDGFEDVPDGSVKSDVSERVGDAKKVTSNALALVNAYVNSKTAHQGP